MKRRDLLLMGLGAGSMAAAIAAGRTLRPARSYNVPPDRTFVASGTQSLGDRARAKGLFYGSEVSIARLRDDTEYASSIAEECTAIVPGYEWKWRFIRPDPQSFDFEKCDDMMDFATQHNLQVRGHTLVWYQSLPDWFEDYVTPANAESVLARHIETVAGRYAGKIYSWDVVNEAIEPYSNRADLFRKEPWLDLLGTDYVELAFRMAHEADPNALLTYNDYRLDFDTSYEDRRREGVMRLLERLTSRNVPIHAVGLQAHLNAHEFETFNPEKLRSFLADIASMGLKIMITEMDVIDQKLPADIATRDRVVASVYEDYLSVVLDEPAVAGVMTWGLSDRYTWLANEKAREDGLAVRPLPLDSEFQRKPAWHAIARAFDNAPPR
ncbi:endo-1,4-beta-xylanase [Leptolyngbya sp. AN02str]|uniref:endo-1,4-beta-xylanase n=1 Tax=Leptolyngbya sp. AN02str TaxID=3423363 RepID=UPI003D3140F5